MKKEMWIIGIILFCASVSSAGPKISGQINNFNYIEGSENIAIDKSQANMGAVRVVGNSQVSGSISNRSVIKNSSNVAKNNSIANMGSVNVVNSDVSGTISSISFISNNHNISEDGAVTCTGGIMLKNSDKSGNVEVYYESSRGDNQNIASDQKSSYQGSVIEGYE